MNKNQDLVIIYKVSHQIFIIKELLNGERVDAGT